jgi:predicted Zn-dependent peptidase
VQFHQHKLENGLQIVAEVSPSARSTAVGFFVRTGARDETTDESGVTHFLEHMVFKGTPRRSAFDVNKEFDSIGANYNAFTSEEQTVFYAAILPEYLSRAVDLLADILRPSLRTDDFDMEKKVIIEEIGMYEDQPMWVAHDNAQKLFFAEHPLGHSILGTPESITALRRDQMHKYFVNRYVPANITVVVTGNVNWDQFVPLIQTHCGGWTAGEAPRQGIRPASGSGGFKVMTKEDLLQEHVFLLSPGPAADSPQVYAANILAMILGDDSGSRLFWALVDPGLADSADTSFHEYEGTGVFYTMFGCEPETTQENLNIVAGLFRQLQLEGVSEAELKQAKNKVMARLVRSSERPMGRMTAVGHNWIYLGTYQSLDEELARYQAVTVQDIRAILDQYPLPQITTVAYGPLKELAHPGS